MALDITGIILIALFFIRGFMKGFIVAVFSLLAILLGIFVSMRLSQALADWMLAHGYTSSGWAPVLAYLILFVGVLILVNLLARVIQKVAEGMMLGMANRIVGGILYALLAAIAWSAVLWLGSQSGMFSAKMVAASVTFPYFSAFAPWLFQMVGSLVPSVKDTFSNLQHFFVTIHNKPVIDVGTH